MSKMFDYVSSKKTGRVAKLEAELEHVMAHCVPASALDEQRDAIIEECARVAETCRVWDHPCATIAAAIRALKDH